MTERFIKVPYFSITPTTVCLYTRLFDTVKMDFYKKFRVNEDTGEILAVCDDNKHDGTISKKSYSRIYRRIFTFLYATDREILFSGKHREKVGFVTLTLPSSQIKEKRFYKGISAPAVVWKHTDKEIKAKCLNQLFVELKKHYDITDRIWKAEKQKNGNIHFHILVNKYIPHADLRKRWNRIINKLGYVDEYKKKHEKMSESDYLLYRLSSCTPEYINRVGRSTLETRYRKVYQTNVAENWLNPNSVDIHSLYKSKNGKDVKNVVAYIAKYMSKSDEHESSAKEFGFDSQYVSGRIWYCSQVISKSCQLTVDYTDSLYSDFEKAIEKIKDVYVITDENIKCACMSIVTAAKKGVKSFDKLFADNLTLQKKVYYESKLRQSIST